MSFDFGSAVNSFFPGLGGFMPGGGGSGPQSPDYSTLAGNQFNNNLYSGYYGSVMSNPNIYSPYGSRTVDYSGGAGNQANVNINLSPDQQRLFDMQNQLSFGMGNLAQGGLDRVGSMFSTGFNPYLNARTTNVHGGPIQGSVAGAGDAVRSRVENALYNRSTARLDPQWQQRDEKTRSDLVAQGFTAGDEGYDRAMQNEAMARNDAYGTARDNAIAGGGAEQSREFGMNLAQGNFANAAQGQGFTQAMGNANLGNQQHDQAFSEDAYLRGLPLNEFNSLRSGAMYQMPTFQPYSGSQVQPGPYFQGGLAQGQFGMDQYNAGVNSQNAQMATLGQLGMAGAMYFSDSRLKTKSKIVGKLPSGLPLWEFEYIFEPGVKRVGVMADDVELVFPAAVVQAGHYKMVDYRRIS